MAGASAPKKRKISRASGSGHGAKKRANGSDVQQMRKLGQTFEMSVEDAGKVLSCMAEKRLVTVVWGEIRSMSACFSQLMSLKTATNDSALVAALESELKNKSASIDMLQKQVLRSSQTLSEELKRESEEMNKELAVVMKATKRLKSKWSAEAAIHGKERELLSLKAAALEPGLPFKCVQRIISFCKLRDVFRYCMRVNSVWNAAAKADLKNRKSLTLTGEGGYSVYVLEGDLGFDVEFEDFDTKPVVKSLMHMTGIQKLVLTYLPHSVMQSLAPALKMWSGKLRSLVLGYCHFPVGIKLHFPLLTHVKAYDVASDDLRQLPLLQIQKLSIDFAEEEDVNGLVNVICNMKSLTDLSVQFRARDDSVPEHFVRIAQSLEFLVKFDVRNWGKAIARGSPVDVAVEELVFQNPDLEEVTLMKLHMTDASLECLSRLTKLKKLTVHSSSDSFSSDAVRDLMTRGSQHALKDVDVVGVKP